jgi:hypothetical protein
LDELECLNAISSAQQVVVGRRKEPAESPCATVYDGRITLVIMNGHLPLFMLLSLLKTDIAISNEPLVTVFAGQRRQAPTEYPASDRVSAHDFHEAVNAGTT